MPNIPETGEPFKIKAEVLGGSAREPASPDGLRAFTLKISTGSALVALLSEASLTRRRPERTCGGTGTKSGNRRRADMDPSSSQFDSFLFWRNPIPALDLTELEDLGLGGAPPVGEPGRRDNDDETELAQFSSFNYWRNPIASVDALLADLNLLL